MAWHSSGVEMSYSFTITSRSPGATAGGGTRAGGLRLGPGRTVVSFGRTTEALGASRSATIARRICPDEIGPSRRDLAIGDRTTVTLCTAARSGSIRPYLAEDLLSLSFERGDKAAVAFGQCDLTHALAFCNMT